MKITLSSKRRNHLLSDAASHLRLLESHVNNFTLTFIIITTINLKVLIKINIVIGKYWRQLKLIIMCLSFVSALAAVPKSKVWLDESVVI